MKYVCNKKTREKLKIKHKDMENTRILKKIFNDMTKVYFITN